MTESNLGFYKRSQEVAAMHREKIKHLERVNADLLEAMEALLPCKPAFRTMPLGAPHSHARQEQDKHVAAEDQARAAIAKAKGETND